MRAGRGGGGYESECCVTENPGILLTIFAFVLVIGPLVFIHEMGHYLAGRLFGVKAEVFSIGFGHSVARWTDKRGTQWKLGWMPLGGYVRFAGDMGATSQPSAEWLALPAEERARTFQSKPLWQRAIIVAAGAIVNFLFAILILSCFAFVQGQSRTPPTVAEVQQGTAADRAGLLVGDRIVSIAGTSVDTFDDVFRIVRFRPIAAMPIEVERAGSRVSLQAMPTVLIERDRFGNEYRLGQLGIRPPPAVREPVSLIEAPVVGVKRTWGIVTQMVDMLGQVISGRRSVKELGGPLKIAQVSGEAASLGWESVIFLIALVSINLGFINLLPVPMLDGGHLFFYAIEAIRRKPVPVEAQEWAYRGGFALLASLMLLVTFNDLTSFGLWEKLGGLIG